MSTDHSRRKDGIFPLIEACHHGSKELVVHLLNNKANPNISAEGGITALHSASAENHVDVLELLLNPPHSCNVTARTDYDETPLHVACLNGCLESARVLAHYSSDMLAIDGKGNTVLHLSAASGSCELIRWIVEEMKNSVLLNMKNKDLDTPAHCAARLGCHRAFSTLSRFGANLTVRNRWQRTPLEEFSQYNNSSPSECAILEECEGENRRNNNKRELGSLQRNSRSQSSRQVRAKRSKSEPREAKRSQSESQKARRGGVGEESVSCTRSATNIMGDDTQIASGAIYNPTHTKSIVTSEQRNSLASESTGVTNVEMVGERSCTSVSTPVCGMGRKKTYHVSQVEALRVGERGRVQSEKLTRRKRDDNVVEFSASGPCTPVRKAPSDKRKLRSSSSPEKQESFV